MKASLTAALFTGLSLALAQVVPERETGKPFLEGNFELCRYSDCNPDEQYFEEQCLGSKRYCEYGLYGYFHSRFVYNASAAACLSARSKDPALNIDRESHNSTASKFAQDLLIGANKFYIQSTYLSRMEQDIGSPELQDREQENNLITEHIDNAKNELESTLQQYVDSATQALQGGSKPELTQQNSNSTDGLLKQIIYLANEEFKKAFQPEFVEQISNRISFDQQYINDLEVKMHNLEQFNTSSEKATTLLKKANGLYYRYWVAYQLGRATWEFKKFDKTSILKDFWAIVDEVKNITRQEDEIEKAIKKFVDAYDSYGRIIRGAFIESTRG